MNGFSALPFVSFMGIDCGHQGTILKSGLKALCLLTDWHQATLVGQQYSMTTAGNSSNFMVILAQHL